MVLLKFILIIFLVGFLMLIAIGYTFLRKVKSTARRFQQRQQEASRKTKVNGNVIYDSRSPEVSQQRIIPDDEGEYVDYEE